MTMTDRDMAVQVKEAVGLVVEQVYDVPAIVSELQAAHGTVDIDEIPSEAFWAAVARHERPIAAEILKLGES